jgi:hypothetical protein
LLPHDEVMKSFIPDGQRRKQALAEYREAVSRGTRLLPPKRKSSMVLLVALDFVL